MYEIWWRDRLLDVVPHVGELPQGLDVRTRAVEREAIPKTDRDWSFPKIVVFALLFFWAIAAIMERTPPAEGDDALPRISYREVFVHPPPPPPKKNAKTAHVTRELFAAAPTQQNIKPRGASFAELWGNIGQIGAGLGPIDALLQKLGGGGATTELGIGGPRGGDGPGLGGGGLHLGDGGGGGNTRHPGVDGALGPKRDEGPTGGITVVTDGLSRDLVAKVIRAHAHEIKYCYERELQSHQDLAGKVSVSFTIGPAGDVTDASIGETTLLNEAVETCMLSRIRRWKFPEPAGGGVVTVNHPWIFRGAGEAP